MLRIIIEREDVQIRYARLKEQLGNLTDSLLIDNLIDVYVASKCPVDVSNINNKPKRGISKQ